MKWRVRYRNAPPGMDEHADERWWIIDAETPEQAVAAVDPSRGGEETGIVRDWVDGCLSAAQLDPHDDALLMLNYMREHPESAFSVSMHRWDMGIFWDSRDSEPQRYRWTFLRMDPAGSVGLCDGFVHEWPKIHDAPRGNDFGDAWNAREALRPKE